MRSLGTESALIRTPAKLSSSSCYSTFADETTNQVPKSTSSIYFQKPLQEEESNKNKKATLSKLNEKFNEKLNDDVFTEIFNFFSHQDFKEMSLVCRQYYIMLRNEKVQIPFELKSPFFYRDAESNNIIHAENFVHKGNWTSLMSGIQDNLEEICQNHFRNIPAQKRKLLLTRLILSTLFSAVILTNLGIYKFGSENQKEKMVIVELAIAALFLVLLFYTCDPAPMYNGLRYLITGSNEISIFNKLQIKQKDIDGFISFLNEQK